MLFVAGLSGHVYFWLGGRKSKRELSHRGRDILAALLRRLLTRKGLSALFCDAPLGFRLLRLSTFRWAAHLCLFGGFVLLFFIGSLGDFFTDLKLWGVTKDTPWFAFVNDISGLLLLAGVGAFLFRRYIVQAVRDRPAWESGLVGGWLLLLILSGYLLEGSRLLSAGIAEASRYSFIGYPAALGLRALGVSGEGVYPSLWWGHAIASLGLVAYLPYSKLFHLFTAPLVILLNSFQEKGLGWASSDSTLCRLELDACVRCGECTRWCEVYAVNPDRDTAPKCRMRKYTSLLKNEELPPLLARLLRGRPFDQDSLSALSAGAYRCTLCGRCREVCPVKIDLVGLWQAMREDLVKRGLSPSGLHAARQAIVAEHNVVNYPNADRDLWVDYLSDVPDDRFQKERAEVLYFVGCLSSFSPAAQDIPMAFARILSRAGVDFTILGGEEWCCGFPLRAAGMNGRGTAEELQHHNIEKVKALRAKSIVFTCPSCFHLWSVSYTSFLPQGVALFHSTQFLAKLFSEGRLRLHPLTRKVTYHDPCDLARGSGIYKEPRTLLHSIPGLSFCEAAASPKQAHCCGGGGDLEITNPDLAAAVSCHALRSLEGTGAEAVVVACPQCKRMFQNAARSTGSRTEIKDIAEIVWQAMEKEG